MSVPECLLVTPDKVKASAIGRLLKGYTTLEFIWQTKITAIYFSRAKMGLKPVQLLCIFLIYEQSLGPDSDWHSYILSLPHSFVTPPFLTDEEMSLIPLHLQGLVPHFLCVCILLDVTLCSKYLIINYWHVFVIVT